MRKTATNWLCSNWPKTSEKFAQKYCKGKSRTTFVILFTTVGTDKNGNAYLSFFLPNDKKHSSHEPKKQTMRQCFLEFKINTLEFIFLQDSAGTDFVLSADISLLPNDDLRENFLKFARKENLFDATSKQAFVIPAFEIKHGLPLPRKRLYRSFVNQNHLKSP